MFSPLRIVADESGFMLHLALQTSAGWWSAGGQRVKIAKVDPLVETPFTIEKT